MCGEASAPPASDSTDIGRVSLASFGVIEDIAEMPGDTQQKDVDITVAESLPKGPEIRADAPDFILDVVERLLNDLGRRWTHEEIAAIAHYSPFYFSRTFRRYTGVAPRRYLAVLRLAQAQNLLVFTDMSVTDICHSVGLSGLGTFAVFFQREHGCSPTAYRERARSLETGKERHKPSKKSLEYIS